MQFYINRTHDLTNKLIANANHEVDAFAEIALKTKPSLGRVFSIPCGLLLDITYRIEALLSLTMFKFEFLAVFLALPVALVLSPALLMKSNRVNEFVRDYFKLLSQESKACGALLVSILASPMLISNRPKEKDFFLACEKDDLESVKRHLDFYEVNPAASDCKSLQLAFESGSLAVLDLLLKDPRIDPNSLLPLIGASKHPEAVKRLLADPRFNPTINYNQALNSACALNNLPVIQLFLADDRIRIDDSSMALSRAIWGNHLEASKLILDHLSTKNLLQPFSQPLADHFTNICYRNQIKLAEYFLENVSLSFSTKEKAFCTACSNNALQIVELFSRNHLYPSMQRSGLEFACRCESPDVVEKIINSLLLHENEVLHYLDISLRHNQQEIFKIILLHYFRDLSKEALQHFFENLILNLSSQCRPIYKSRPLELFLSLTNVNPNIQDSSGGNKLLNQAIRDNDLEFVQTILAHPKIDPVMNSKKTALTLAKEMNNAEIIKLLEEDPRFQNQSVFKFW